MLRHSISSRSISSLSFSPATKGTLFRIHPTRNLFVPPDPTKLPKPTPRRPRKWIGRTVRIGAWTAAVLGAGYAADSYFNALGLTRALRVFRVSLIVGLDYKINFRENPPLVKSLNELHRRNAQRVLDVLVKNGGLYLKMGQAMALQSAILPPEFQKMFSRMFDDASQNEWKDVEAVIREDFGKTVEEVFGVSFQSGGGTKGEKGVFEKRARASASVAQVHWARLPDGREVAVKVQKREIASQMAWDLWAFSAISKFYSWWFSIPMYTLTPYISERLKLETDFVNEATNSEQMRAHVEAEPRLKGRVYVPKTYPELSSKRVLTAEWIEGVPLWDKTTITDPWYGGYGKGSPGAGNTPLDDPATTRSIPDTPLTPEQIRAGVIKPNRDHWRGFSHKGGLGLSAGPVMHSLIDLFSAQMFSWGIVHCDPHPGNILIRRLPSGQPQLVLLDHGLYVKMSNKFRNQYSRFWKGMLQFDPKAMKEIGKEWGLDSADIFASATLQQPYESAASPTAIADFVKEGKSDEEIAFAAQERMRASIAKILSSESSWPREMIFLSRALRILQGNNQSFGSPVNRVKIMGIWASRSLFESENLSLADRFKNLVGHCVFRLALLGSDLAWWVARFRQLMGWGKGMDDDLDLVMRRMAGRYGFQLNHGLWEG